MAAPVPGYPGAPGAQPPFGDAPWRLAFGANPEPNGTRFRVWAPRAQRVTLRLGNAQEISMLPEAGGEFQALAGAPAGTDYGYLLDNGPALPDPVSRWQPGGVHGPSRVVDPAAFPWSDRQWAGIAPEALVIYELHVGTFTPPGSFQGVVEKLPYLRELGVTAVELMPVAAFPGTRNWGYDGVHLYAPQHSYGGPDGLKHLVDACHQAGLAVILDVVYNHLGPEGNYLGAYGPYFSARYRTPWGDAINYDDADCDPVRRWVIDNALYWLTEYHVDGLRLDAVHGIFDFGARHVLEELSAAFHAQARHLGRPAWLIAESDLNDTRVIRPTRQGGWNLDAQWSDDFHHALHARLTGTRQGYFVDFGKLAQVAKAVKEGFVYDGQFSPYRRRRHGNSAADLPGNRFVFCTQNHDQVANGSVGERSGSRLDEAQQLLAAATLLCAPALPLLFMGQEYGERAPFHFFTSHGDAALAAAVSRGRREELSALLEGRPFRDPQAPETFEESRLDWRRPEAEPHAGLLRFHRALLALRREHACLNDCDRAASRLLFDEAQDWLLLLRGMAEDEMYRPASRGAALLVCNLSPHPRRIGLPVGGTDWERVVFNGEARFLSPPLQPAPPQTLAPECLPDGLLTMPGHGAVLYLCSGES